MNQNPEISIIILNYNGIDDTKELLLSIVSNMQCDNCEVIVVDNGSSSDEASALSREFNDFTFIRSEKNLGFAGGNNYGIQKCKGEFILLLNNDTLLIDSSLCKMIEFLKENPEAGAVSPRILFGNPSGTLQYAGFTALSYITLRNKCIGYNQPDTGQFMTPYRTAYTHGAAMMVRREVIDKAGIMNEDYFLYYEEFDWCERIKGSGYGIWYFPYATVLHKESRSTGKESAAKRYYLTRNRLIFSKRHRKGIARILAVLYQLFIAATVGIFRSLSKGRKDLAWAILEGVKDFLIKKYGEWKHG